MSSGESSSSYGSGMKDAITIFKDSMNVSSFIAGSIAGASGVLVGHPFDSLKVRMQVGQSLVITGWNAEVVRQLYRGIAPPLATVGCVAAINFALYESFKALLRSSSPSPDSSSRTPLSHIFLAGCLSGAVMTPFTSPMGVIKIQLQVAKQMTFRQCIRDIWQRNHGPRAFYRGIGLSYFMESPGRGVYLYTYEAMKALCMNPTEFPLYVVPNNLSNSNNNSNGTVTPYPLYKRAISASVAGIVSWLVMYPFDVIKARIQLDISRQKYRSTWHCIAETYKEGGIRGFFRGLSYTMIRAGPVAATILPIYDVTKAMLDETLYPNDYHRHHSSSGKITPQEEKAILRLEEEENICNASTSVR